MWSLLPLLLQRIILHRPLYSRGFLAHKIRWCNHRFHLNKLIQYCFSAHVTAYLVFVQKNRQGSYGHSDSMLAQGLSDWSHRLAMHSIGYYTL